MTANGWRGNREAGFTLIEVLVAATIVLILVSVSGFLVSRYVVRGRIVGARSQVEAYSVALGAYFLDASRYPTTEQGLQALWSKPLLEPVPSGWSGPYLDRQVGTDPWGNAYVYRAPGPHGLPFEIVSLGADGSEGGEDGDADIVSWQLDS